MKTDLGGSLSFSTHSCAKTSVEARENLQSENGLGRQWAKIVSYSKSNNSLPASTRRSVVNGGTENSLCNYGKVRRTSAGNGELSRVLGVLRLWGEVGPEDAGHASDTPTLR